MELWGIMGNYGELWGNLGGIMGEFGWNYGELWWNYEELWGIMVELWGIMENYGELLLARLTIFMVLLCKLLLLRRNLVVQRPVPPRRMSSGY